MDLTVIGALPYGDVRAECHFARSGIVFLDDAIRIAQALPQRSVLVPVPGHDGSVTATVRLARAVAKEALAIGKQAFLRPLLTGASRQSLYEVKKAGGDPYSVTLGFRLRHPVYDRRELDTFRRYLGCEVVLVDNVVDTGRTASEAAAVVGTRLIAAIGVTGKAVLKQETINTEPSCSASTV